MHRSKDRRFIETNIRQRGIGNPNPIKLSRCIKELERIYGIEHGGNHGNQYSMPNPKVSDVPTQEDLADMIGISIDTIKKLIKSDFEVWEYHKHC